MTTKSWTKTYVWPVDKGCQAKIYCASMLRKYLAVILLLSWIVPSGFDLVDDLYFPGQTEIQNEEALPGGSGYLSFTNKLVESAESSSRRRSIHPEDPAFEVSLRILAAPPKTSKLHKLHSVFLI
jgi:hypothetical protein